MLCVCVVNKLSPSKALCSRVNTALLMVRVPRNQVFFFTFNMPLGCNFTLFGCNFLDFGNMFREKLHPMSDVIFKFSVFWGNMSLGCNFTFFGCNIIDFDNMFREKLHPISDVILLFWETYRNIIAYVILHLSDVIKSILATV